MHTNRETLSSHETTMALLLEALKVSADRLAELSKVTSIVRDTKTVLYVTSSKESE